MPPADRELQISDGEWPHISQRTSSISWPVMFRPLQRPRNDCRGPDGGGSDCSNSGKTRTRTRSRSRGGNCRRSSTTWSLVSFDYATVLFVSAFTSKMICIQPFISTICCDCRFILRSRPSERPAFRRWLRESERREFLLVEENIHHRKHSPRMHTDEH